MKTALPEGMRIEMKMKEVENDTGNISATFGVGVNMSG